MGVLAVPDLPFPLLSAAASPVHCARVFAFRSSASEMLINANEVSWETVCALLCAVACDPVCSQVGECPLQQLHSRFFLCWSQLAEVGVA